MSLAASVASTSLVGRSGELAHLHARRRDASAAHGGIVLVSGEAGLGKSRLLSEFRRDLVKARVRVGGSQCLEFARRPFALALDALSDLRGAGALPSSPAASREDHFEAIVEAFLATARSGAVVAFFEDVHWADPATVDLLWLLARKAAAARILIVATYRSEAIRDDHALFGGIARIERLPNASTLRLQSLGDVDLRALIDEAVHRAGIDVTYETRAAVARLSEGNPLFAEELLKTAIERKATGTSTTTLPTTIRAAVLERLRPLTVEEQQLLAQASVIGRRFDISLLEAMAREPRDRILTALRHARDLQLVDEALPTAFVFRHAVTREAIYESFLAAQVREFHSRIARAIETASSASPSDQELAYHWWAAGDHAKAARYGELAGDAAMAVYAYDEAARLYGYCLDSVDRRSDKAAAVLIKLAFAYGRNGLKVRGCDAVREASDIYRQTGNIEGECEAAIEYAASLYQLRDPQSSEVLIELRPRLGDPQHRRLRVKVDVALAQILVLETKGEPTALLDAAAPDLDESDARTMSTYHATRAAMAAKTCKVDEYRDAMNRALEIAAKSGVPNYEAVIRSNLARGLCDFGRLSEADENFERADAFTRKHKLASPQVFVLGTRARRRLLGADLAGARADILEALPYGPEYEVGWQFVCGAGTAVASLLDDAALMERCFDENILARGNPLQVAAPFAARMLALDRGDDARSLLRRGLTESIDVRVPFDFFIAVARYLDGEDVANARRLVEGFARFPQDVIHKATLHMIDAIIASRAHDEMATKAHAEEAAAAFRAIGFPLFEADALGLAGDVEAASAIYRRAGAVDPFRPSRLSQVADGRRRHPAGFALTDRERDVVALVGGGLSNAEIASRMSVTLKTVEKHLGSVYVKFGVNTRAKLMAYLHANPQLADISR